MTTLKKTIGDGGGGNDRVHGSDTVYDVLKAMALEPRALHSARLATIATGIFSSLIVKGKRKPVELRAEVEVCGSAGSSVVEVRQNGTVIATLTFANTDADPTKKSVAITAVLADNDKLDFNVSTAPTGGTGLTMTVYERFGTIDVEGETVP
jgi:hypothetical protein